MGKRKRFLASELENQLLLGHDVAKMLGVSAARVRQMESMGDLPAAKTPNGTRIYLRDDVEELLEKRRAG